MKNMLDKIKKLGVKNIEIIKKDDAQQLLVVRGIFKKDDVVAKIFLRKNEVKAKNLKKEYLVLNLFYSLPINEYFEDEDSVTYIRNFIDGKALAERSDVGYLMGYDQINSKFDSSKEEILISVGNLVTKFQGIDLNFFREDSSLFQDKRLKINLDSYVMGTDLSQRPEFVEALEFYNQHKDLILNHSKLRLVMNDLNPSNVIFDNKGSRTIVMDYEWAAFDDAFADITCMWLYLHEKPDWQKTWTDQFIFSDQDKLAFRFSVVRQILSWFGFLTTIKKIRNEHFQHMWHKYLIYSLKSFDKLVDTK